MKCIKNVSCNTYSKDHNFLIVFLCLVMSNSETPWTVACQDPLSMGYSRVFLASRGGGSMSQGGCMLSCRREPSSIRANKRKRTGCEQGGHFCRLRGFQDIKQFRGINPSIHIAAIGFVLSQPGL